MYKSNQVSSAVTGVTGRWAERFFVSDQHQLRTEFLCLEGVWLQDSTILSLLGGGKTLTPNPWNIHCTMLYSQLSLNGHLYKTDTSIKRTPRVGPCISLLPLLTLYKMDTSVRRTLSAGPKGVCLRESWLYHQRFVGESVVRSMSPNGTYFTQ